MKIGIELGQIVPGACGGIVPLLEGVLRALFVGPRGHDVTVFCTPGNRRLFHDAPATVEVVTLPGDYFGELDRQARERPLDVLFRSYPHCDALHYPLARQVVLVPDRRRDGTNVLSIPTGAGFTFKYGPGSFGRHRAEAARCGLAVVVLELDDLAWDVDEPGDLPCG